MANLTADKPRAYDQGERSEYPVASSVIIYEGAAVGDNGTGYARPLQAGNVFLGFAEARADNRAGSGGAVNVRVRRKGRVLVNNLTPGLSIAVNSKPPVYMSDDDTFTPVPEGNSLIGYVDRFVSTDSFVVAFDADLARAALHNNTLE